ncbi:hypothetical protein [Anaeroselena agilis]|uniref:Uncharacterized protein n=1 Tax=Anaeroselena agilis TaxID=3063788 RepID=A0ABU3NXF9_9FIRM|nr:hypothetical protein [Selenomonadales bacterium 4137-cl]
MLAFQSEKDNRIVIPGMGTLEIGSYTDKAEKEVFAIYFEDTSKRRKRTGGEDGGTQEVDQRYLLARKATFAEAQEAMRNIANEMRETGKVIKVM